MSGELLSVEQVADQLGLHVRTVRGYVRDGRLKAVRIGKQYRIAREDLAALTGQPTAPPPRRHEEVSSIVPVEGIDATDAGRLSNLLMTATAGPREGDGPLRVETMHDADRSTMKIILLGGVETTAELLKLIAVITEEEGR
ncbi:MAG: helix-turn-helix domain-containing protein [Umezawaea sp.]